MAYSVREAVLPLLIALAAAGAALVAVEVVYRVLCRLGRRDPFPADIARRARRPAQWFAVVFAAYTSLHALTPPTYAHWTTPLMRLFDLAVIGVTAWFLGVALLILEDRALQRYRTDVRDNVHARRVHTQVRIVRRVTLAVIGVIAVGAMLTTFPNARTTGRSLLLSAGVLGVLAALAAQSLLANVLAGMQLSLSGAIRLDDVVIVEKEWGHIEEITLTYVVVRIWDNRRLVLPTSYFASHPFQNWTRTESALLGTVEVDVDWTVPLQPMREELQRIVTATPLWDERVSLLQITEATGPRVRVRCLVSAGDADTLWDLRCLVRERLVQWLRDRQPQSLPRFRTEIDWQLERIPALPNLREPGSGNSRARAA